MHISIIVKAVFVFLCVSHFSYAVNAQDHAHNDISLDVKVSDRLHLTSGETEISLWGIEYSSESESESRLFHLKARSALENKIDDKKISCIVLERDSPILLAQCINQNEEDLSLFLLQNGFATADRSVISETIYEIPYLSAERTAQNAKRGVWGLSDGMSSASDRAEGESLIWMAVVVVVVFLSALAVFAFYLLRSFGRVVDVQNQTMDLASKERVLKDKEKYIIASMLDAEIQSNRSKIEAYLIVYEETLNELSNTEKVENYKKAGEVVQMQPALNRSVFDGNTNKLELLGLNLASEIIHYYARIKTVPDYIEVSPEMSADEARSIIEKAVDHARKLDGISTLLCDKFVEYALVKKDAHLC